MQIEKENSYIRDKTKLINKNHLLDELIESTERLFMDNPSEKSLRFHKINCKKDKNKYSITIVNMLCVRKKQEITLYLLPDPLCYYESLCIRDLTPLFITCRTLG